MRQQSPPPQPREQQIKLLLVILYLGSIVVGLSFAMIFMPLPDGVVDTTASTGGKVLLGLSLTMLVLVMWRLLDQYKLMARKQPTLLLGIVLVLALVATILALLWWTWSPLVDAAPVTKFGVTLLVGFATGIPFGITAHAAARLAAAKFAPDHRQQAQPASPDPQR